MTVQILTGDCRELLATLPDASVQCVVTSPPYHGLRAYGGDPGMIGMEPTIAEHIDALVAVFREVRRVLHPTGTVWLNYGDRYWTDSPVRSSSAEAFSETWDASQRASTGGLRRSAAKNGDLKNKDLIGLPWRLAFALQADGWWLRSAIVWHKPNPMPESVTDRPTSAYEHIFLLSRSGKYFYDADAIAERSDPAQFAHNQRYAKPYAAYDDRAGDTGQPGNVNNVGIHARPGNGDGTRNARNVWTIATQPFSDAHFAVFPPEIPRRCILAGTSERGQCPACGAPWRRVVERSRATYQANGDPTPQTGRKGMNRERPGESDRYVLAAPQHEIAATLREAARGREDEMRLRFGSRWDHWVRTDTSGARVPTFADAGELHELLGVDIPFDGVPGGWQPSCPCDADPIPQTVLDPFAGAGTTLLVADRLGRHGIGIEVNPDYVQMAQKRIRNDAPLFAEVETA